METEQLEKIPQEEIEEVTPKKRRGNPAFYKGMPAMNKDGYNQHKSSPGTVLEKPTNRQLREKSLLELARKLRPYQTKAIQTVVKVLDNPDASDQNKLKAASMMVGIYKDLLGEIYDYRYDDSTDDAAEELNQTMPTFSLRMLEPEE